MGLPKRETGKQKRSTERAVRHSLARQQLPAEASDDEVVGRAFCFPVKSRPQPASLEDGKPDGSQGVLHEALHSQPHSAQQPLQTQQGTAVSSFANSSCLSDPDARSSSMNSAPRKRQKLGSGRAALGQRKSQTLPVRLKLSIAFLNATWAVFTLDASATEHIRYCEARRMVTWQNET